MKLGLMTHCIIQVAPAFPKCLGGGMFIETDRKLKDFLVVGKIKKEEV